MLYGDGAVTLLPYEVQNRSEAIGWLFADTQNALMGENLTLDLAVAIDAFERRSPTRKWCRPVHSPRRPQPGSGLWSTPTELGQSKADLTVEQTDVDTAGQAIASNDAAGRVLESAGTTRNRLSHSSARRRRITRLLASSGSITGLESAIGRESTSSRGREHSGTACNRQIVVRTSLATHTMQTTTRRSRRWLPDIMDELAHNTSFNSESVSEHGAEFLGKAISVHLDSIAGALMGEGTTPTQPGATDYTVYGTDDVRWRPDFTPEVLRKLLGVIGEHPSGAEEIRDAAAANQDRYFDLAEAAIESGADPKPSPI